VAASAPTPLPPERLMELWRDDVPLRERTLWRLLHESGAPVAAVLALDVEDLDLDDRRARSGRRWITWRSGAAALLPMLIAGRGEGPLFLTQLRPGPHATADRCPHTGRQRLSYERAEYLFKRASAGHTLRELRQPRLLASAAAPDQALAAASRSTASKLGARNRIHAIKIAAENGWL